MIQFPSKDGNFHDIYYHMFGKQCKNITFITNHSCNLNCSYCYEHHKDMSIMSIETGKRIVDFLFEQDINNSHYINDEKAHGIILEFIGGEPLLAIDVIDAIMDYFLHKAISINHRWAIHYMISIASNGVDYFKPSVIQFLHKWYGKVNIGITIDGNQELHDSCRKFPDGSPSYHLAAAAFKDAKKRFNQHGTKLTISKENLKFLATACMDMIDTFDLQYLQGNPVFEAEWDNQDANLYYHELKKLADWLIDSGRWSTTWLAFFSDFIGKPISEQENQPYCFPPGTLISTPHGTVPIECIQKGDQVYTLYNQSHTVESVIKREAPSLVEINATGAFPLPTTEDHPILCRRYLYMGFNNKRKYATPKWVKASEIRQTDKIALYKHCFGNQSIDKNLAYLIGRWIGDGSYSGGTYALCCGQHEKEYVEKKLDAAHISYKTIIGQTTYIFYLRKCNTELLSYLSDCGVGAFNKHFPAISFNFNQETLEALLCGLLEVDGCTVTSKYNRQLVKFNSISQTLSSEVLYFARALGYFPTCYVNNRAGESTILGRSVQIHDRYEVYWFKDKKSKILQPDPELNVVWTTVRSLEKLKQSCDVYNLTVSGQHSFIANNVIVHNCGGSGKMLAFDVDGTIYPCLRYSPISVGNDMAQQFVIGNLIDGIAQDPQTERFMSCLECITRRSMSTDECWSCPIASGCATCTAWQFEHYGDGNHRCTNICIMHKARVMATSYFYNTIYRNEGESKRFSFNLPAEWAIPIIGEEEYKMLLSLASED